MAVPRGIERPFHESLTLYFISFFVFKIKKLESSVPRVCPQSLKVFHLGYSKISFIIGSNNSLQISKSDFIYGVK